MFLGVKLATKPQTTQNMLFSSINSKLSLVSSEPGDLFMTSHQKQTELAGLYCFSPKSDKPMCFLTFGRIQMQKLEAKLKGYKTMQSETQEKVFTELFE